MIRVLLADDHRVVRAGLEALLAAEPDVEVVGAAVDGDQALQLTATLHPDVVLMDLSMPNLDGIAATRRLQTEHPSVAVLVLTSFADRDRVLDAIDAGASGYLLKDVEPDELLRAVRAAARGDSPLDPRVARVILEGRAQLASPSESLTTREREVLTLVGEGLANKQIARRLGISEKTVKSHLTNVFQRIGVADRTQAAVWLLRNGDL
jgi:DNA-binding NarL/FixJ family response regulator